MTQISGVDMAAQVFTQNKAFADSGSIIELTGNNDGVELNRIESVWGLKGDAYCAMGQYWNFAKVYCNVNGIDFTEDNAPQVFASVREQIANEWLRFDPLVANMQSFAQQVGDWRDFSVPNDIHRLRHGDYIAYRFSTGHHIEQFDKWDGTNFWVVGWNTTASGAVGGNSNDPGDGGGCYYKHRSIDSSIWGWIPWTYGR